MINDVLASLDSEINNLKRARALLAGDGIVRGRKKRTMSAASREKIAAAQRARWAKVKKAAKSILEIPVPLRKCDHSG